jgi:hypothetical protein
MKFTYAILLTILSFSLTLTASAQEEEYFSSQKDSIATVKTINGNVFTGVITNDNDKEITLESASVGIIIIAKIEIKSIEYNKNKTQDPGRTDAYLGEYAFAPTAFNIPSGEVSFNTHYFAYVDFEFGLSDNISLDIGASYPVLAPIFVGLKASVNVADKVRLGLKLNVYGIIDYWGNQSNNFIEIPLTLFSTANGMITLGDQNKNLTIGGIFGYLPVINMSGYGGYIGGYKKIKQKLGIGTELLFGIENNDQFGAFSGSVLTKYYRTPSKIWTFGIHVPFIPDYRWTWNGSSSVRTVERYLVVPLP